MKFTLLFAICIFAKMALFAQTTTFLDQNFDASTVLADYNSATPSASQFNFIGVNPNAVNPTTTTTFSNQKIVFDRPSSGAGCGFTRLKINNTATASDNLVVSFKMSVNNATVPASGTNPGLLYVGQGYLTNFTIPANASTFSRLGIIFTTTPGNFILKDWASLAVSAEFSGEQSIMWVMNNTGSTLSYTSPLGSVVSLANSKVDVWVGTTHVFNAVAPQTSTVSLSDFKFAYANGTGSITFDDILIRTINPVPLPIELTYFKTEQSKNEVKLRWQTTSETNNDHFDIEYAKEDLQFMKIGEVKAQKNTISKSDYTFIHNTPPSGGKGFYRLKQCDIDGKYSFSKIEEVVFLSEKLRLYPNPVKDVLYLEMPIVEPYSIFNAFGRMIFSGIASSDKQIIPIQNLPNGMYFVKMGKQIVSFMKI